MKKDATYPAGYHTTYTEQTEAMREAGAEHGRAAASWLLDGNSTEEDARALLRGIEEGDPAVLDQLPSSPLSGEWADEPTPSSVFADVLGLDMHAESSYANGGDDRIDELLTAYEDAFLEAVQDGAETEARTALGIVLVDCSDGTKREFRPTGDERNDVAAAVELEHHCEDGACEIREALEFGFPMTAAHRLSGATETPYLDAVLDHYGTNLHAETEEEWEDWKAHHDEYARKCDACGSYTFAGDYWEPEQCGNCLAPLPAREEDKTYSIYRYFRDPDKEKEHLEDGLTLEEAQAHCQRDDTRGEGWFDGYTEE